MLEPFAWAYGFKAKTTQMPLVQELEVVDLGLI
ncbi:hypothetical protein B2K_39095 [Paenibacillus mucilaginosus K02]|uniref:Uncharacterized protein n=1 Tax=Paenibacillus mucilaginosus K02 TaxID=997761 RepID=R9ULG2_9BACL|nr:hypothetical protein B2K_39095 [Paenibacillus mucilaginosus K02]